MNNKLLIGIIVAVVVVGVLVGVWRSQAPIAAYNDNIQPLIQQSMVLDSDIHRILSSETTVGIQRQQISTADGTARELRASIASIVPPGRYKDGHAALVSAASARLKILDHFSDFLDHMFLIKTDQIGTHVDKMGEYAVLASITGQKRYADLAQAEKAKLVTLLEDNQKWAGYAEDDLTKCENSMREYVSFLRKANAELGVSVATDLDVIDLRPYKQPIAEIKQLVSSMLSMLDDW